MSQRHGPPVILGARTVSEFCSEDLSRILVTQNVRRRIMVTEEIGQDYMTSPQKNEKRILGFKLTVQ